MPSDVIVAVLRSITLADDIMAAGSDIPARPEPWDARAQGAASTPRPRLRLRRRSRAAQSRGQDRPPSQAAPSSRRRPSSATASTSAPGPRRHPSTSARPTAPPAAAPAWKSRTSASQQAADTERRETDAGRARRQRCSTTSAAPAASSPTPGPIAKAAEQAGRQAALLAHAARRRRQRPGHAGRGDRRGRRRTRQLRHRPPPSAACRHDATRSTPSPGPPPSSRTRPSPCTKSASPWRARKRTWPSAREARRAPAPGARGSRGRPRRGRAAPGRPRRGVPHPGGGPAADVQHVLEQIRQTERELQERRSGRTAQHDRSATARARQGHRGRPGRAQRAAGPRRRDRALCTSRPAAFGEFARPDLRPLSASPSPRLAGKRAWPDARRAGETSPPASRQPADRQPGRPDTQPDPVAAVKQRAPGSRHRAPRRVHRRDRGGRQVTEGIAEEHPDRMSVALKDFTDALAACEEDYRVDWEPGAIVTVHVIDDEGRKPVRSSPRRIDERAPRTRASSSKTASARSSRTSCSPRWRARSTPGSSPPAT